MHHRQLLLQGAVLRRQRGHIVDRVVAHVDFVGGTYGASQKPAPFLCLAFKLLQLAPGDDVLREYSTTAVSGSSTCAPWRSSTCA